MTINDQMLRHLVSRQTHIHDWKVKMDFLGPDLMQDKAPCGSDFCGKKLQNRFKTMGVCVIQILYLIDHFWDNILQLLIALTQR
jgi:hypothetical protein